MSVNPYASPLESSPESPRPRLALALAGLLLGNLCGAAGGFLGGALTGATHALVHDEIKGGGGVHGLFARKSELWDFTLFHGAIAAVPLCLLGGVLGFAYGAQATRQSIGISGIVYFGVAAMVVGLGNGILATGAEHRVIPHILEGPVAGTLFGLVTGVGAWAWFRNRINKIAQLPPQSVVSCVLWMLFLESGILLLLIAMIPLLGLGTYYLQVVMRLCAIGALLPTVGFGWSIYRRSIARGHG